MSKDDQLLEEVQLNPFKISSESNKLKKQIRHQMEFYFSDSNLAKDRFLKQEILKSDNGFIDLTIFLKFNKIRSLTEDVISIQNALSKSKLLELNEEMTKVKRKIPFTEPSREDFDQKTIYVENLPRHATHDFLKKLFGQCGKVTYVSLPKFKSTGNIKGFGFIEFESKEGADNALKNFNDTNLSNNNNVGKFPKYNKQLIDLEKKASITIEKETETKRKRNVSSESETEPKIKEAKLVPSEITANESDSQLSGDENNKNKNRHHKKSIVNAKKLQKEIEAETKLLNLKIISKVEWLNLKKEYLKKQKENMAKLRSVIDEQKNDTHQESFDTHVDKKCKETSENIDQGCIIKLVPKHLNEPLDSIFKLSKLKFKNDKLPDYANDISYVDMDKNLQRIYLRFKSSEIAKKIASEDSLLCEFNKFLLDGIEENEYLSKIHSNRINKQAKNEKKLKGKQNIAHEKVENTQKETKQLINSPAPERPAGKHIVFEDD